MTVPAAGGCPREALDQMHDRRGTEYEIFGEAEEGADLVVRHITL